MIVPKTVPIVAAVLFAAAAIAVVVATSLLFPNRILEPMWDLNRPAAAVFHAMGRVSGIFLLLPGGAAFAGGLGLLRRRKWAWWFAVVLFGVDGLGDIVSFFATGDWVRSMAGAAISSAFVYSLVRQRVRVHFGV